MAQDILSLSPRFTPGAPPIPREHGAWVMLYAPLLIGLAGVQPFQAVPALLLILAVTGAFLAQNAAGLLIKPRPKPGTAFWTAVFTTVMAASGLTLLVGYGRWELLWIGAATLALFGVHAALLKGPVMFRMDRFQWSQLLAVGGLALTAPAAFVVAQGHISPMAWLVWGASVLYFGSGVFNVNMHFAAAKHKGELDRAGKRAASRDNVIYHGLMAVILIAVLPQLPVVAAVLAALGYAPVLGRGLYATVTLTKKLPSLKQVGLRETAFACWFALCLIVALQLVG